MTVYVIKQGCPLCHSDVKGNDQVKYFCKQCNVLFQRRECASQNRTAVQESDRAHQKTVQEQKPKVAALDRAKHVLEQTPKTKAIAEIKTTYSQELEEEETLSAEEELPGYELESPDKLVASAKSDKLHAGNCHFLKKIHKENRRYLSSIEEGKSKGYELCVCLRRQVARNK